MLKGIRVVGGVAAIVCAAGAAAQPVAISTLPPGAINNVQATVIAKVAQENSDLQMRVITFNSPSAIIGAVQNRQADFAYTSNDEAGAAFRGTDDYQGQAMKDLRVAMTVFPFVVGIMVKDDSDIKRIADLKGRKFPTGWQGFLQGLPLSNALLATEGLTLKDVDPVPAANLLRAADDFKAGKTVGTMFAIGAPKVAEIHAAIGGVRFLSLPNTPEALKRMQAVRPEYHLTQVKPAPHLPGVKEPTTLMQYHINVLTNRHTRDEIVYKFVKAVHGQKAELVKGHPSFNAFTDQGMAVKHIGAEYHPGAVRFYKEAGIWKDN